MRKKFSKVSTMVLLQVNILRPFTLPQQLSQEQTILVSPSHVFPDTHILCPTGPENTRLVSITSAPNTMAVRNMLLSTLWSSVGVKGKRLRRTQAFKWSTTWLDLNLVSVT